MANLTVPFPKKVVFFLLIVAGIFFALIAILAIYAGVEFVGQSEQNSKDTEIQITLEGVVQEGTERDRLVVVIFMETSQGTYYLVDHTNKNSRKQKADPKYCPTEGTIGCYRGAQVRTEGFITGRRKWIVPWNEGRHVLAQELKVTEFEVFTSPIPP